MRIRTIKPEFWRSSDIAALSIEARLLFIGLWSYVDDNGVGRDEPQLIQCELFPLDPFTEGSMRVHGALSELSKQGLITRFSANGRPYIEINSWERHQKINRPSKPRYPKWDPETCTLTEPSVSPHDTLTEGSSPEQGSGNRDQGTRDSCFRVGGPGGRVVSTDQASAHAPAEAAGPAATAARPTENFEKNNSENPGAEIAIPENKKPKTETAAIDRATPARRATRLPADWAPARTASNLAVENGSTPAWLSDQLDRFRDYWTSQPGQRGTKIDWDATWRNWLRKARDKERYQLPAEAQRRRDMMADASSRQVSIFQQIADGET